MNSNGPALKTIGAEFLAIVICGILVFFYAQSFNQTPPATNQNVAAVRQNANAPELSAYQKDSKSLTELLGALKLRPETDLIVFVIDTSSSMSDDQQELRGSIRKTVASQKGKSFEIVAFDETARIVAAPTRNPTDLENQLDRLADVSGSENSYNALVTAADSARPQFKNPAIILLTDAAPNDGRAGSSSTVTLDKAASSINAANAELHIFAAFDQAEEGSGGSAATSPFYPQLAKLIKAGGLVHFLKRN